MPMTTRLDTTPVPGLPSQQLEVIKLSAQNSYCSKPPVGLGVKIFPGKNVAICNHISTRTDTTT